METREGSIYIRKRTKTDIWKNLYEFILWETGKSIPQKKIPTSNFLQQSFKEAKFSITAVSKVYKQQLTHQTIQGQFIHVHVLRPLPTLNEYILIKKNELKDYPLPKLINAYLQSPAQELL
jgi:A/G-specific adenine glycosylase